MINIVKKSKQVLLISKSNRRINAWKFQKIVKTNSLFFRLIVEQLMHIKSYTVEQLMHIKSYTAD